MEVKATNVKVTIDYTCPICGKEFKNIEMPFTGLSSCPIDSGWSDVDNGWELYAPFHSCPKCKSSFELVVHRENP